MFNPIRNCNLASWCWRIQELHYYAGICIEKCVQKMPNVQW